MATYATPDDLFAYTGGLDMPEAAEDQERLLELAEVVVDEYCGGGPIPQPGLELATPAFQFRRFVVSELTPPQRLALQRATCATALWIAINDDATAGGAMFGPNDLAVVSRPSSVPVQAIRELSGSGLISRSLTVRTPPEDAAA